MIAASSFSGCTFLRVLRYGFVSALLARALSWVLAAFAAGTAASFLLALLWGFAGARGLAPASAADLQALSFIVAALAAAAVLAIALRHEPLDLPPARRWWAALLAAACLVPLGAFLSVTLAGLSPEARTVNAQANLGLMAAAALCGATITPLAEELFFRGWLWRPIAKARGPVTAALVTGALFLLAHLIELLLWGRFGPALARALLLLPLAAGLSVVRGVCGSPRASLVVHALYNLATFLTPLVLVR